MTSRRNRIKGIAHIPLRRKNAEGIQTEINETDIDTKNVPLFENTECKLKIEDNIHPNNSQLDNSTSSVNVLPEVVSNPISNNNTNDYLTHDGSKRQKLITSNSPMNMTSESTQSKLQISRRKFIKPTVSVSNIKRISKPNSEKQSVVKSELKLEGESTGSETEKYDDIMVNDSKKPANTFIRPSKIVKVPCTESTLNCNTASEMTLNETHLTPQNEAFRSETTGDDCFEKPGLLIKNGPCSDSEYPPPPPSPTKINRSRIKAIPRFSNRKTSFSASESEDESRKNNRNRNDSVCSTTSGITEPVTECMSPQRPKETNSVIQRKCSRSKQTRKLAEARREFQRRFGMKKPDRQRLIMMDLIFYNPEYNPTMSEAKSTLEQAENDNTVISEENEKVDDPEDGTIEPEEENQAKSDEENEMPVPQIKINASGDIVVDEQSLVIERKELKKQREELQRTQLVDGDFDTGYGVYKKRKRSKNWSPNETVRFYKALNIIGTDFSLMSDLFPKRTRRELKRKFKKEESTNGLLVDKALMQPCQFDYDDLKHEVDMEEKEMEALQKQQEETSIRKAEVAKLKKEKVAERVRKRKVHNEATIPAVKLPRKQKLEPATIETYEKDSDADESDVATQSHSEEEIWKPSKPTRSGRVPKLTQKFDNTNVCSVENVMKRTKLPDSSQPADVEPGSIIIITEKGPNDEPVYKIYMVTPDQNAAPLNLTSDLVTKAIQFKKGLTAQNIMTISATASDDDGDEERNETILENNVTIPADETVKSMRSGPVLQDHEVALNEIKTMEADDSGTEMCAGVQ